MLKTLRKMVLPLAAAAMPGAALAHTGQGAHGLADGLMHPMLGADHVLAMVAVGLWAASLGGRALWAVPAAFVAMMGLGAALTLPGVEGMIGLSVIALGLIVALQIRVPTVLAAAVVGLFALFHGAAHGAEIPVGVSGLAYAGGFLAATAVLHGLGLALGLTLARRRLLPVLGGLTALAGVALFA